jgi:murein L,D-transpeptidase YafK
MRRGGPAVAALVVGALPLLIFSMKPALHPVMSQARDLESSAPAPAETRLRRALDQVGAAYPPPAPTLKVFKRQRRLELWSGGTFVKAYRVGLGAEPERDKEREGDHRTPVGEFYVCTRNDRSKFHLFLGVSYPNVEDAERGLRGGLITRPEYRRILDAQRRRERPPWDTSLGGQVGVHGFGAGSDWTWGCIALENDDIEELWLACPLKTPILIFADQSDAGAPAAP